MTRTSDNFQVLGVKKSVSVCLCVWWNEESQRIDIYVELISCFYENDRVWKYEIGNIFSVFVHTVEE